MQVIGPVGRQINIIDGDENVDRVEDWYAHGTSIIAADSQVLSEAIDHTDTEVAAANAHTDSEVAGAKAYADGQVATDRGRLTLIESKNTTQDGRLSAVESENAGQDVRISSVESAAFVGGGLLMEDPADPGFFLVGPP